MSQVVPTDIEKLRRYLFTPMESMEDLHAWIKVYLGLDLPDCVVDENSTSSPMHSLWEVYDKARKNNDPEFNRILTYAARDAFKTLSASILEVLMVFHLGRSVAHMAAIEAQAKKSQEYVKKFLRRPLLRDFVVGNNQRKIEVTRYHNAETGVDLTQAEFERLTPAEKTLYSPVSNYIVIVIATLQGANSEHVPFMCVDGETGIAIESEGRRTRVTRTARGIFNRLAGISVGGRLPTKIESLEVSEPAVETKFLTFNFATGAFEFKRVERAHRKMSDTLVLKADGKEIVCTPDHPLYVMGRGFVEAGDVVVGDRVVFVDKMKGNSDHADKNNDASEHVSWVDGQDPWEQVLMGSLLGDGAVYRKQGNNAYFREQHCVEQADYLAWKRGVLSQKIRVREHKAVSGYTGAEQVAITSGNSPLLNGWETFRETLEGVERLGALGLAVWYMDDGCDGNGFRLSTECFTREQNEKLASVLERNFNIDARVGSYEREGKEYFYLRGGVETKRRLVEVVGSYVHPQMAYKFDVLGNQSDCVHCGRKFWFVDRGTRAKTCGDHVCRLIQAGTLHIATVSSVEEGGVRAVYDFTVADNHNFFGNGFLNKNCVDEVDVVANPKAYEEAQAIPAPYEGKDPITLLTSTRKFSFGLVQKEIDNAHESGLQIRHWNIIDVTQRCPESRHRPDLPRIQIYHSDSTLRAISERAYQQLLPEQQQLYEVKQGYQGCLDNCRIFAACKGRLATSQISTSNLLKKISHTQNQFKHFSPEMAKAQLLCWKPSSEGLVYPRLDRGVHMKTAAEIAHMITGESYDPKMTKAELIALLKTREVQWFAGMDFGYTHNFAVVIGVRDGARMFIIDAFSRAEFELGQKLDICETRLKPYNATVYPDVAYPSDIKTFKRNGYRMRDWDKYKGSVVGGIEVVRLKLWPAVGDPELYFLDGDDDIALVFTRLSQYHWKLDPQGKSTDEPDDEEDDECDALRYMVMNVFAPRGKIKVAPVEDKAKALVQPQQQSKREAEAAMWQQLMDYAGLPGSEAHPLVGGGRLGDEDTKSKGRKGSFVWEF